MVEGTACAKAGKCETVMHLSLCVKHWVKPFTFVNSIIVQGRSFYLQFIERLGDVERCD